MISILDPSENAAAAEPEARDLVRCFSCSHIHAEDGRVEAEKFAELLAILTWYLSAIRYKPAPLRQADLATPEATSFV